MEKIKYVLIPFDAEVDNKRFYVGFQTPDAESYFYMARQSCKKISENYGYYLAKLDLNNKYNHKLIDINTHEEKGVLSDSDLLDFFEECNDYEMISDIFELRNEVSKKGKDTNNKELKMRVEILEKEIEIIKLKLKNL